MNNIRRFLCELNKVFSTSGTKVRIGNKGDGGYVVLDELCQKAEAMYSLGIGDDVSFECDFVDRYPKYWISMFDPTIECLPETRPQFIFHKNDIRGMNLSTIPDNSILKMDTEFGEWEDLMSLDESVLSKFSQIVVEFHIIDIPNKQGLTPYFTKFYKDRYGILNDALFGTYYRTLEKLNKMFYIYHIHPNNSLPKITVDGCSFPPLLEISFVRRDLVENVRLKKLQHPDTDEGLDYPNKADRPDIVNYLPFGM